VALAWVTLSYIIHFVGHYLHHERVGHMDQNDLLRDLDDFMTRHGFSDSTFGLRATGDGHLIKRIRDGRAIRRSSIVKIRRFMARYEIDAA
jgi:hypothetical protein